MNMIIKKHWIIFLAVFVPLLLSNALYAYLVIVDDWYSEVLYQISSISYFPALLIFDACIDRPCDNAAWFEPAFFTTAIVVMPVVWGVISVGIVRLVQMIRSKISRKQ